MENVQLRQIIRIVRQQLAGDYSQTLTKFSYLEQGAEYFLRLVNTPVYCGYQRELALIEKIIPAIKRTTGNSDKLLYVVDLGPGDGIKSATILSALKPERLIYGAFDISESLLCCAQATQQSLILADKKYHVCDFTNLQKLHDTARPMISQCDSILVILLGNTLANEIDMGSFLTRLKLFLGQIAKNYFLLVGMELYTTDSSAIIKEYNNNINRKLTIVPLKKIGLDVEGSGDVRIVFNEEHGRIEERFTFKTAFRSNLSTMNLNFQPGDELLLSVTYKPTHSGIKKLFKKSCWDICTMKLDANQALIYLQPQRSSTDKVRNDQ